MKRVRVPVILILMLVLAPVMLAQEEPVPPDAVVIPLWLMIVIGIAAVVFLAGVLLLMGRVVEALKESNPPGTVDQVTKALGDGLERVLEQMKTAAPGTPTNLDDFLLAVTDPLTRAIIEKLRGEGMVVQATPPTLGQNARTEPPDSAAKG